MPEYDMLEEAEFEVQLTALGDDQLGLIKFNARQQYAVSKVIIDHGRRIKKLEGQNKKTMGIIGGAGAIVATAAIQVINYLTGKPS